MGGEIDCKHTALFIYYLVTLPRNEGTFVTVINVYANLVNVSYQRLKLDLTNPQDYVILTIKNVATFKIRHLG